MTNTLEKTIKTIKKIKKVIISPVLVHHLLKENDERISGKGVIYVEDEIFSVFPSSWDIEGFEVIISKNREVLYDVKDNLSLIIKNNDQNFVGEIFYRNKKITEVTVYAKNIEQIWLRQDPILRHEILKTKKVAVLGVGSVGSRVALELGRAGIGELILVDPDRLEIHNIVRHVASLKYLGRKKINAVEEIIHFFNPLTKIVKFDLTLDENKIEEIRNIVNGCDLVVVALGPHEANIIVDQILYPLNIPAVYSGVFKRGYGGTIYTILPEISGCYSCAHEAFVEKGILEFYMKKYGVPEFSLRDLSDQFIDYGAPNILIAEPAINTDISIISNIQAKIALWILSGKNITKMIGQIVLVILNTEKVDDKQSDLNLITTGHMSWSSRENCNHHQTIISIE